MGTLLSQVASSIETNLNPTSQAWKYTHSPPFEGWSFLAVTATLM